MVTSARIVLDSISPLGIRLLTMHLRYPRFIHPEFMTHRAFGRNARSSRAVPVERLLAEAPYIPHFMKNQPGMQSFEEMDVLDFHQAQRVWMDMVEYCRSGCKALMKLGVHKQWANRPLEWFGWIDVLVTSTQWDNWYALRDHPQAMPEIQKLAVLMREATLESTPKLLDVGEWHLPYIGMEDRAQFGEHELRQISVARCARLSYKPFDADIAAPDRDLELFEKLLIAQPVHASPAEHQATPDSADVEEQLWHHPHQHGNLVGWRQFRKLLDHEAVTEDHWAVHAE